MKRRSDSHKGENGKVAIIGGSEHIHGAPLFAALAAEASGVDLVFPVIPLRHVEVAKNASLNFMLYPFNGDDITDHDREPVLELLATMDAAVIGPGLTYNHAVADIIAEATCPLILDASALQSSTLSHIQGKHAVLTPHLGELERMNIQPEYIADVAMEHVATIVLKGEKDRIVQSNGEVREIIGGNAGLTVGGTGDALAGFIAGLIAQKVTPDHAATIACTILKKAATLLYETKGYSYTTHDVINQISHLLHTFQE